MLLTTFVRAIELLKNALAFRREAKVEEAISKAAKYWTPETVEAAIEAAGRADVFAEARRLGWSDGYAPLWVWGNIAREVAAHNAPQSTVH